MLLESIAFAGLVIWAYMSIWYIYAQIIKRNDVADIAWGLGFVVLTVSLLLRANSISFKTWIIVAMVLIWGLRLAVHIYIRHRGKPEDGRYVSMRKSWKYKSLQSYTNVFMTQGFFLILVSLPIILYFDSGVGSLCWYNYLGLLIWIVGFSFETVSDFQLAKFVHNKNNKGKIMRSGLWRYTRHPNYFGEISLWWGLYLFTLLNTYWYIGIIGPLTITYLIIGVSGIPMLEKRYKGNKEYESYQLSTSAFFPLPPRRKLQD